MVKIKVKVEVVVTVGDKFVVEVDNTTFGHKISLTVVAISLPETCLITFKDLHFHTKFNFKRHYIC